MTTMIKFLTIRLAIMIFHCHSTLLLSNHICYYFDCLEPAIDDISYNDSCQDVQPTADDNDDISLLW